MKEMIIAFFVTLLLLGLPFAHAIHQTQPAETTVPLPGPNAEALYTYITVEDKYIKWNLWPGTEKQYKARPPLDYITTYISDNARFSIRAGEKMANGSLIVTENYTAEKKLSALFVMYKIKGYNPSAGDWFWAQFDKRGRVVTQGKVKACIECHAKQKSNDFIFSEEFVK